MDCPVKVALRVIRVRVYYTRNITALIIQCMVLRMYKMKGGRDVIYIFGGHN